MPRIRTIKPQFWIDERLGCVPRDVRLLYIGLWNLCDDRGVFEYRPARIRVQLFPYDGDISGQDVAQWIDALVLTGDVVLFEEEGEEYGHIPTFSKHQEIKKPSKWTYTKSLPDTSSTPPVPHQYPTTPPPVPVGNRGVGSRLKGIGNRESILPPCVPPKGECAPAAEPAEERLCDVPDIPETPKKLVEPQQKYGEFQNVRLTAAEHEKLVARFGAQGATDWIEELSLAKASKGYKSKSDYATILAWERRRARLDSGQSGAGPANLTGGNNGRANATSGKSIPGGSRALPRREDYESPEEYRARYQREHAAPVETNPGGHPAVPGA